MHRHSEQSCWLQWWIYCMQVRKFLLSVQVEQRVRTFIARKSNSRRCSKYLLLAGNVVLNSGLQYKVFDLVTGMTQTVSSYCTINKLSFVKQQYMEAANTIEGSRFYIFDFSGCAHCCCFTWYLLLQTCMVYLKSYLLNIAVILISLYVGILLRLSMCRIYVFMTKMQNQETSVGVLLLVSGDKHCPLRPFIIGLFHLYAVIRNFQSYWC